MSEGHTISASEIKAKCLDILDRIGRRELERVVITNEAFAAKFFPDKHRLAGQIVTYPMPKSNCSIGSGSDLRRSTP